MTSPSNVRHPVDLVPDRPGFDVGPIAAGPFAGARVPPATRSGSSPANRLPILTLQVKHRIPPVRLRIVILGAGFGGLFAAKAMRRLPADIVLIDRHNHHLFQPLLYQVATAGLAPSDIAWPIRSVLARQRNLSVRFGEVVGIDTGRRAVALDDGVRVGYDVLICATGSRDTYFGNDAWARHAWGLKGIDDATAIRRRMLLAFERAETTDDPLERDRLMRFVIVGAGPTGVELAGAIAELAHFTLAADFRRIDPRDAKVVLVEAGERVLAAFEPSSSDYARRALERKGVEVRLETRVSGCDERGIDIGDARIESATVLWAAGVVATPVGRWLGVETDRGGRVPVGPTLSVGGLPDVFVIGDAAAAKGPDGRLVPGIAPAAKQQGRYLARLLAARLDGASAPGPFLYRHAGNLATIGRRAGVAELGRLRLTGFPAWALWGVAHVYFLIGLPSPLLVTIKWLWEYATYKRGARLITGVGAPGGTRAARPEGTARTPRDVVAKAPE